MRVFLTGGSGWVGRHLIPLLLSHGHSILALSRTKSSTDKILTAAEGSTGHANIEILEGGFDDLGKLAQGAAQCDAVIHLGFIHDFNNFAASAAIDLAVIKAMTEPLEGTGKAFIGTGGAGINSGDSVTTEDYRQGDAWRGAAENHVLALADRGMRSMTIRLATSVHGKGDKAFVPIVIDASKRLGYVPLVSGGAWIAVHVKDAAELYLAALEKGEAGRVYHGVGVGPEESVSTSDIAGVIADKLHLDIKDISKEDAVKEMGPVGMYYGFELRATSKITQESLGWKTKEIGLLEDMRDNYFLRGVRRVRHAVALGSPMPISSVLSSVVESG